MIIVMTVNEWCWVNVTMWESGSCRTITTCLRPESYVMRHNSTPDGTKYGWQRWRLKITFIFQDTCSTSSLTSLFEYIFSICVSVQFTHVFLRLRQNHNLSFSLLSVSSAGNLPVSFVLPFSSSHLAHASFSPWCWFACCIVLNVLFM